MRWNYSVRIPELRFDIWMQKSRCYKWLLISILVFHLRQLICFPVILHMLLCIQNLLWVGILVYASVADTAITTSSVAATTLPPSTEPLTTETSSTYADTSTTQPATTGHNTFLYNPKYRLPVNNLFILNINCRWFYAI